MPEVQRARRRPKHLNLLKIRLPLPALVSILHRVSGVLLILALPLTLLVLDLAVSSERGNAQISELLTHPFIKLAVLLFGWSLFHHLCAGIRFLLAEVHVGVSLAGARTGSWLALGASLLLTGLFAAVLLL